MNNPSQSFQRAIVIGGSMTGLFAARILSETFAEVLVLERDVLPIEPTARRGVPQSRHAHVLLTRGQQILNQLFPGIEHDLETNGAELIEWSYDALLYGSGGWAAPQHSNLKSYGSSRQMLEWIVRNRVQQLPNVKFLTECRVERLLTTEDQQRVSGVEIAKLGKASTEAPNNQLTADLVVDASGRTSRLPEWLKTLGRGAIGETVVASGLGYATRWYEIPAAFKEHWKGVLVAAQPPHLARGGLVLAAEGNRWLVTLSGYNKDYPPTDEEGFMAFMKSLATPYLYEAVKDARPLTPIYGYQRTDNVWRHYEQTAMPDGIVALGDAVCAFNPVYGQGMTMGALGALELQRCLRQYAAKPALTGMSRLFQQRLAKSNQIAWALATAEDFRWPGTIGERSNSLRLMHSYVGQLQPLIVTDPAVAELFWSIAHLVTAPVAMFAPKMLFKVAKHTLSKTLQKRFPRQRAATATKAVSI